MTFCRPKHLRLNQWKNPHELEEFGPIEQFAVQVAEQARKEGSNVTALTFVDDTPVLMYRCTEYELLRVIDRTKSILRNARRISKIG